MNFKRFSFDQAQNFRRACRLNSPRTLTDLRSIYGMVLAGQQFGLCSGYQG